MNTLSTKNQTTRIKTLKIILSFDGNTFDVFLENKKKIVKSP
jgi:hypothetical protein